MPRPALGLSWAEGEVSRSWLSVSFLPLALGHRALHYCFASEAGNAVNSDDLLFYSWGLKNASADHVRLAIPDRCYDYE
jgi:hypothetical protein